MPYTVGNPPDQIKKLPEHAIEIWVSAFNSALKQYKDSQNPEAAAAATAWAAVKKQYKQEGATWVAKEAADFSDADKRQQLHAALITEYSLEKDTNIPEGINIEEVFEEELVYSVNGQSYRASYSMGDAGEITIGEPSKVMAKKVYEPMESLRTTYSEIIQEAGRRNANLDSARVKKIVELCQELLSSEDVEDSSVKKAAQEAESVLSWLKTQEATKTEDGLKFPAAAFALSNTEDSGSWKLRMWEDLDKGITKAQLNKAAAALSPGGKTKVPAADLAAVKRKIRAAYRKLGVDENDIPKWVKETETRQMINSYVPLTEAKFDKGRADVIVIQPGFNATKDRYYPAEVLKRDFGIFEGQKMYADHPTDEEDKARPERSIKDWVATLKDVKCDEDGVVTGTAEILEPWLMQKLASLREKEMLSEMGISINAIGSATEATIEGIKTTVIEKLVAARSVDFVTEPGAGGIVTFYESDRASNIDLVELKTLKEKRPDLVSAIESAVRAEMQQEVKHKMEDKELITDLEGQVTTLTTENTDLKGKIEEAAQATAKAEAQAAIKEAVDKAELPDAAKERLIASFKDAQTADGITEAIQAEVEYIAKLSEAGKVQGMGGSKPDTEKGTEALKESFKRDYIAEGKTDEEAEKLAGFAVTGR